MATQLYVFFIFILTGFIIGIIFDLFRILRKTFKTNDFFTLIEDILFWLISALVFIYSLLKFNNWEIRFYIFVALFIGIIAYLLAFSKKFIIVSVKINKFIILIIKILIIKPICFMYLSIFLKFFKIGHSILKKMYNLVKFIFIRRKKKDFV